MIKQSLPLRIMATCFLALAFPLLIYSFIYFQENYYESVEVAKANIKQVADFQAIEFEEIIPQKEVLLNELIYFLDLDHRLESMDLQVLSDQLSEMANLAGKVSLIVVDIQDSHPYKVIAASEPTVVGVELKNVLGLNRVIENGEGALIDYFYSPETDGYLPRLLIGKTILSSKTKKPLALILTTVSDLPQINHLFSKTKNGDPSATQFGILDPNGLIFMATDSAFLGQHIAPLSQAAALEVAVFQNILNVTVPLQPLPIVRGQLTNFFEFIFQNQIQIGYLSKTAHASPKVGFHIFAYVPKEIFFANAVRYFLILYASYGIILLFWFTIAYFCSKWIGRPLRQLTQVMNEVRKGNLFVRFKQEKLGFEINELGAVFNQTLEEMLKNIQKSTEERIKKHKYEREVALGSEVQVQFFPVKFSSSHELELTGLYIPSENIGSDFYSWYIKDDETISMVVIDAPEKGISSCLYSLAARSLFRTHRVIYKDAATILKNTNTAFCQAMGDSGVFVRAFFAIFDKKTKELTYYSCGHVPGVVCRADGRIITLSHSGMALGLVEKQPFNVDRIQLEPEDLLLIFSDGLLMATNSKHQHFSEKRVHDLLQQSRWNSPEEVLTLIKKSYYEFIEETPQDDEVVMIALRVKS